MTQYWRVHWFKVVDFNADSHQAALSDLSSGLPCWAQLNRAVDVGHDYEIGLLDNPAHSLTQVRGEVLQEA